MLIMPWSADRTIGFSVLTATITIAAMKHTQMVFSTAFCVFPSEEIKIPNSIAVSITLIMRVIISRVMFATGCCMYSSNEAIPRTTVQKITAKTLDEFFITFLFLMGFVINFLFDWF